MVATTQRDDDARKFYLECIDASSMHQSNDDLAQSTRTNSIGVMLLKALVASDVERLHRTRSVLMG